LGRSSLHFQPKPFHLFIIHWLHPFDPLFDGQILYSSSWLTVNSMLFFWFFVIVFLLLILNSKIHESTITWCFSLNPTAAEPGAAANKLCRNSSASRTSWGC
jgi:hypothetical protein